MAFAQATHNISPVTRARTEMLKTQYQSQLYQPRVKNPLKRLSQTSVAPSEYMLTTEMNRNSQLLRQVKDHLQTRQQTSANLQLQMADYDLQDAIQCAEFFKEQAVNAENAYNELRAQIQQLSRNAEKAQAVASGAENSLSLLAEYFGNFDRNQLISQLNRIRQSAAEATLLATQLGYQIPYQPDILDVISDANFDTFKDGTLIVDGVRKSAKNVSFMLISAEIQCLREENFLRKQTMSEYAKAQSSGTIGTDFANQNGKFEDIAPDVEYNTVEYQNDAFSRTYTANVSQNAVSDALLRTAETNPIVVYYQEFKCSGVAACKELINLRTRLASYLLREQRFAVTPLLARGARDNESLRALVCGLQNELFFAYLHLYEALAVETNYATADSLEKLYSTQNSVNSPIACALSDEQIQKLAEIALNEHVQVDAIPTSLARKIDFLVAHVEEQSRAAADAKLKAGRAEITVEALYTTLERRNEMSRRMNYIETELEQFLSSSNVISDIDADVRVFIEERFEAFSEQAADQSGELQQYTFDDSFQAKTMPYKAPSDDSREAFARAAYDQAEMHAKRLVEEYSKIIDFCQEIRANLEQNNREKFEQGGYGFLDALDKIQFLLKHARELHVAIAKRDACVTHLQQIIDDLIQQKAGVMSRLTNACTTRNGLILAYLRLRKQNQGLAHENNTIRMTTMNTVYMATQNLAARADRNLSEILARDSNDYTYSVKGDVMCVHDFLGVFQRQLNTGLAQIQDAVTMYKTTIESKAQKACQTDRARKTEEVGLQAVAEPADAKNIKKK